MKTDRCIKSGLTITRHEAMAYVNKGFNSTTFSCFSTIIHKTAPNTTDTHKKTSSNTTDTVMHKTSPNTIDTRM
ncbi:hypothetical protein CJ030_MR0G007683 [Morella rubra]|uniref:Uncharacterized protein n=1 Tax=Morella rubra TaxID=262757 RepID=A0A6A1UJF1_9ROSI|nr:hypothetical protein CJ030_MR0G007683 [Morella rubra]